MVQVPLAVAPREVVHTSQAPAHAVLQQTASEAKPLAQRVGSVEGWPVLSLQEPLASQVLSPVHVSGSSELATWAHAPVPVVHLRQVPLHAPEQQIPLLQTPEPQSAGSPQVSPLSFTSAKSSAVALEPLT
jgi:hypothetical protein